MTLTRTVTPEQTVRISADSREGLLSVPENAHGLVIFADGSISSWHSPWNIHVARSLNCRRHATLLFDLLTEGEARDRANVCDLALLGSRVLEAVDWVREVRSLGMLPIGLFGARAGAAAALVAAARLPTDITAVVSLGGRPVLAAEVLSDIRAPTLLIVGGVGHEVLTLHERTAQVVMAQLSVSERELIVVPGASDLFKEPGAFDRVVTAAGDWFDRWLPNE